MKANILRNLKSLICFSSQSETEEEIVSERMKARRESNWRKSTRNILKLQELKAKLKKVNKEHELFISEMRTETQCKNNFQAKEKTKLVSNSPHNRKKSHIIEKRIPIMKSKILIIPLFKNCMPENESWESSEMDEYSIEKRNSRRLSYWERANRNISKLKQLKEVLRKINKEDEQFLSNYNCPQKEQNDEIKDFSEIYERKTLKSSNSDISLSSLVSIPFIL